jgi:hypothetical protein
LRLALLLFLPAALLADGGKVILQGISSGEIITVFAIPSPLHAGEQADISVLVQKASDRSPLLNGLAHLSACDGIHMNLDHAKATNKLLFAGYVTFRHPGDCAVTVQHQTAILTGAIRIAAPESRPLAYWPYFLPVPLGIGLFALNRHLERVRRTR